MEAWYVSAYMYISLVVYPLIPFSLILALNFIILTTLWRRQQSSLAQTASSVVDKVEKQLTKMIAVVCITYVILMFPFEIRVIYMYYNEHIDPGKRILSFNTTFVLALLNSGMNFFLYTCSSQKFRLDLKILFMSCCKNGKG